MIQNCNILSILQLVVTVIPAIIVPIFCAALVNLQTICENFRRCRQFLFNFSIGLNNLIDDISNVDYLNIVAGNYESKDIIFVNNLSDRINQIESMIIFSADWTQYDKVEEVINFCNITLKKIKKRIEKWSLQDSSHETPDESRRIAENEKEIITEILNNIFVFLKKPQPTFKDMIFDMTRKCKNNNTRL